MLLSLCCVLGLSLTAVSCGQGPQGTHQQALPIVGPTKCDIPDGLSTQQECDITCGHGIGVIGNVAKDKLCPKLNSLPYIGTTAVSYCQKALANAKLIADLVGGTDACSAQCVKLSPAGEEKPECTTEDFDNNELCQVTCGSAVGIARYVFCPKLPNGIASVASAVGISVPDSVKKTIASTCSTLFAPTGVAGSYLNQNCQTQCIKAAEAPPQA
jgi:hypothetical protein